MINFLLYLLEKFPYRTKFGLSLAGELKIIYYMRRGQYLNKCLCGGNTVTYINRRGYDEDESWETFCKSCDFLYDED